MGKLCGYSVLCMMFEKVVNFVLCWKNSSESRAWITKTKCGVDGKIWKGENASTIMFRSLPIGLKKARTCMITFFSS